MVGEGDIVAVGGLLAYIAGAAEDLPVQGGQGINEVQETQADNAENPNPEERKTPTKSVSSDVHVGITPLTITDATSMRASFTAPQVREPTDTGTPKLTRYRRVMVAVKP